MVRPRKFSDEEILGAAREVFLEHGPGASTATVADAVGLSQAALFKRFGTKDVLMLRALLPNPQVPWVERLDAGPDDRPFPEQLQEICVEAIRFFAEVIPCLMTLKASTVDIESVLKAMPEPPPLRVRRAAASYFAQAVERGLVRAAEPDRMALMLVGSLQSRAFMAHLLGVPIDDAEAHAHAAAVVDVLWNGIRPPESP